MALEPVMSRFSVLPDDVPEPTGNRTSSGDKPKKKKKPQTDTKGKMGAGDASAKKKTAAKGKVTTENCTSLNYIHSIHTEGFLI